LRRVARVGTVLYALVVSMMVTAGPALASYHPDDGEKRGSSLGVGLTIFYFVVIPIGAFLIIGGLAVLPSALSRPRYRPGKTWDHDPQWFGGPEDGQPAAAPSGDSTSRGGASAEW
jgi:hypothetical protein